MKLAFRAAAVLCAAAFALPVVAQTFGEITGRVTDASGAAAPGAAVTATNMSTNAARQTVTTETGDYTFPSLPPGTYTVRTEKSGFKVTETKNVSVSVQQSVRLDFTLTVGQVSESISVEATAVQLESENATVGTVIDNKRIVELPLNGRNYLQLVALTPNATTLSPSAGQAGSRQGGDRAIQSISVAGQRIMFDNFTLDGVNNTDPNFNTYVVLPSIDALQEFKVQTGVYPAEFGHNSTQINVVDEVRRQRLSRRAVRVPAQRQVRRQAVRVRRQSARQEPVQVEPVRVRTGRSGAHSEAVQRPRQAVLHGELRVVPAAAQFQRHLYGSHRCDVRTAISAASRPSSTIPPTKAPFPGNIIPHEPHRPDLEEAAATTTRRPTSRRRRSTTTTSASAARRSTRTSSSRAWISSSPRNRSGPAGIAGATRTSRTRGSRSTARRPSPTSSSTWARTRAPSRASKVNEARFGYTRFFNSTGTYLAFNKDVVSEVGIPGLKPGDPVQWGIPNVTLINYSRLGDDTEGPYANDNNTLQFIDNFSWIHGKHTFRFGGEFRREHYNQVGNQFARGQFTFQPNATQNPATKTGGDTFADFLLGDLYQSEAAVSIASAKFRRNGWSFYVDDTWKVTPKLTLALGLRYELTPPFYDTSRNVFSVYIPYEDRTPNVADQSRYPLVQARRTVQRRSCTTASISAGRRSAVLRRQAGRRPGADRLQRFRAAHRHHLLARLESG